MRTRRKAYYDFNDSDSQDNEKLNTEQALIYMRHMWSILPEKIRESSIYIDPVLITWYQKDLSTRKNAIRWFERLDYFSKKYVFLPAFLWKHWILVIICNPGGDLKQKNDRPSVLILDSLKSSNKRDLTILMRSLMFQLYKQKASSKNVINKIPILSPDVPKQENDNKCGFLVLYYMTLFLKMCPEKFTLSAGYPFFMTKAWFTLDDFKLYETGLLKIFSSKGMLLDGVKNDQDTINLIRSCLSDEGIAVRCPARGEKNGHVKKKRVIDEESQTTSFVDMTLSEDKSSEGFADEQEINMDDNTVSGHKKLLMKLNPRVFDKVVENLTPQQKDWVKNTGFGDLLPFKMSFYPVILGYKLVSNFNPDKMILTVGERNFKITETDVQNILGLPRGSRKVEFLGGVAYRRRWRKQYWNEKTCFRVCIRTVIEKMSQTRTLDWDFKMNYLCYLSTMLIEQPANSYVRQTICGFSGQLDKCSNYNWCSYLLKKLKETHKIWQRDRTTHNYTGSIAFLVFFFLDRIIDKDWIEGKRTPRYLEWMQYSLKSIQDYFIEMDCLSTDGINIPNIDKNTLNSWKYKGSEEDECDGDQVSDGDEMFASETSNAKADVVMQDKGGSDEKNGTSGNNVKKDERQVPADLGVMLSKSLKTYKDIQNDILNMLGTSKRNGYLNVVDETIKNKFVEMNNIANVVAEDCFDSPDARA